MASLPDDVISAELANDVAGGSLESLPRRWFYTQDGERHGPVTGPELRAAAELGFLGHRDRVRCGLDGAWVRAANVGGLFNNRNKFAS